jgi:hypothetical protein
MARRDRDAASDRLTIALDVATEHSESVCYPESRARLSPKRTLRIRNGATDGSRVQARRSFFERRRHPGERHNIR